MYVAGILIALIGILSFSRIEVSGELRHRVYERQSISKSTTKGESAGFFQILKNDKKFARYELYQFLSGVSNMILEAPLIYLVSRQLQASYTVSIAVIMAIPFLMRTVSVPVWARYFDVVHVTKFRTRLGLVWVLSHLILWAGAMFSSVLSWAWHRPYRDLLEVGAQSHGNWDTTTSHRRRSSPPTCPFT